MDIRHLGPGDVEQVVAASSLFDRPVSPEWASEFLGIDGHHLFMAYVGGVGVGFVSGVEMIHPDKGREMFLYELSVDAAHRRQGIGRALVEALRSLAIDRGCYGMWVGTEPDNIPALSTYRAAGADEPDEFLTLTWTFPTSAPSDV